jgi:hypothetical protein
MTQSLVGMVGPPAGADKRSAGVRRFPKLRALRSAARTGSKTE